MTPNSNTGYPYFDVSVAGISKLNLEVSHSIYVIPFRIKGTGHKGELSANELTTTEAVVY